MQIIIHLRLLLALFIKISRSENKSIVIVIKDMLLLYPFNKRSAISTKCQIINKSKWLKEKLFDVKHSNDGIIISNISG
jgi:hypothetical protein